MKLVFATNNKNKVKEINQAKPNDIEILGLADIECFEDIPETSETIAGNALQKARYVYENYKVNCFADDTGLEVNALDGAPGVYSARYAGVEKDANKNMDKLLSELWDKSDRTAAFKTVIALIIDGEEFLFEGIAEGEITNEKCGKEGFGYDPVFQPNGYDITFAEMSLVDKNKISHRGKAVKALSEYLTTR